MRPRLGGYSRGRAAENLPSPRPPRQNPTWQYSAAAIVLKCVDYCSVYRIITTQYTLILGFCVRSLLNLLAGIIVVTERCRSELLIFTTFVGAVIMISTAGITMLRHLISKALDNPTECLWLLLATSLCVILLRVFMDKVVLYTMGVHSMAAASKPLRLADVDIFMHGVAHPVSYWTDKGGRPYQEDRYDTRTAEVSRKYRRYSTANSRSASVLDLPTLGSASTDSHDSPQCHKDTRSSKTSPKASSSSSSASKAVGGGHSVVAESAGSLTASIYGVFDGHGGVLASEFCKRHLLEFVEEELNACRDDDAGGAGAGTSLAGKRDRERANNNKNGSDEPGAVSAAEQECVRRAMSKAFQRLNSAYCTACGMKSLTMGSTVVVAVLHGDRIIVAHVGDSRCILVQRGGRVVPLTSDHKPNRLDERVRIESLGGKVTHHRHSRLYRVEGMLAVSRAIGDMKLSPYVVCEPEVTVRRWNGCGYGGSLLGSSVGDGDARSAQSAKELERRRSMMLAAAASGGDSDDLFLVIASDGLWDVMTDADVGRFVYRRYLRVVTGAGAGAGGKAAAGSGADNASAQIGASKGSAAARSVVDTPPALSSFSEHKQFITIAKQLCEEAIILGSSDNITVQVIDLTQCRDASSADEPQDGLNGGRERDGSTK